MIDLVKILFFNKQYFSFPYGVILFFSDMELTSMFTFCVAPFDSCTHFKNGQVTETQDNYLQTAFPKGKHKDFRGHLCFLKGCICKSLW